MRNLMHIRPAQTLLAFAITLALSACATDHRLQAPEPLIFPRQNDSGEGSTVRAGGEKAPEAQRFNETPKPAVEERHVSSPASSPEQQLKGEPLTVNVEGLPLPAFINEVFGNQLKLSFQIAPEIEKKTDLVTLRLSEPSTPADLFATARQVLRSYGVAIERQGDLYVFNIGRGEAAEEPPLLVTGETLPSVPVSHRPIFQLVNLKVASAGELSGWVKQAFEGQRLNIQQDPLRNAIWLRGNAELVRQATEVVAMLDQPLMRGRYSIRVQPLFSTAEKLSARLVEVLTAEGYSVSTKGSAGIVMLPIPESNAIIVFAQDRAALEHTRKWIEELDKPVVQGDSKGIYLYALRNTRAENVVRVIGGLLSGDASAASSQTTPAAGDASTTSTNQRPGASSRSAARPGSRATQTGGGAGAAANVGNGRLVVDTTRNALLFQGSAEEWAQLMPVIRQMDVPAKQVLVEVVIAEVTLTDDFKFGIDWAINSASLGEALWSTRDARGRLTDIAKGATIKSGAFSYYPISSNGLTRALLNTLSQDNKVSILQAPRLMVRSGEEASINVGTDIPIVTSQANVPGLGADNQPALVNQVEYRTTGVTLSVSPIVYEGGRVDLNISQELSEAQSLQASQTNPAILTRNLSTSLSVSDGGSVLLGGLISNNSKQGSTKIPLLGDLPLIGSLFGTETKGNTRTELLILIVPYVLDDGDDAEAVTRAFRDSLQLHAPVTENAGKNDD